MQTDWYTFYTTLENKKICHWVVLHMQMTEKKNKSSILFLTLERKKSQRLFLLKKNQIGKELLVIETELHTISPNKHKKDFKMYIIKYSREPADFCPSFSFLKTRIWRIKNEVLQPQKNFLYKKKTFIMVKKNQKYFKSWSDEESKRHNTKHLQFPNTSPNFH